MEREDLALASGHHADGLVGGEDDPSWGGWRGRFVRRGPLWVSAPERDDAILRWAPASQRDWAARADCCVKPPEAASHRPASVLNGGPGRAVLAMATDPGAKVTLSATGSTDPDGDRLGLRWFVDQPASDGKPVAIDGATTAEATLTHPLAPAGGDGGTLPKATRPKPTRTTPGAMVVHDSGG